jgi:hypothetical protein
MLRHAPFVLALTLAAAPGARAATSSETEGESGGFAPAAATSAGTGFGQTGQFVVSMGLTSGQHAFFHKQSGGGWQLGLSPSLDYFLMPRFSVGGLVAYTHASGGAGMTVNASGSNFFKLGGRAGYNLDLTERFSVWPLGGFFLDYTSVNHTSNTNTSLFLYAPFLWHIAPHFFGGLGPSFQLNVTGPATNQIGVDSMIGGWF